MMGLEMSAYKQGETAAIEHRFFTTNPYPPGDHRFGEWLNGWFAMMVAIGSSYLSTRH